MGDIQNDHDLVLWIFRDAEEASYCQLRQTLQFVTNDLLIPASGNDYRNGWLFRPPAGRQFLEAWIVRRRPILQFRQTSAKPATPITHLENGLSEFAS
jgi:hypothetical protein